MHPALGTQPEELAGLSPGEGQGAVAEWPFRRLVIWDWECRSVVSNCLACMAAHTEKEKSGEGREGR